MNSFLKILKCCNNPKESDEYKNLPTVVINANEEKSGDKTTVKSSGSNKIHTSSEKGKLSDGQSQHSSDLKNINFSIIDENPDYSNSMAKEMENLNIKIKLNNTLPKARSSSTQCKRFSSSDNTFKVVGGNKEKERGKNNLNLEILKNLKENFDRSNSNVNNPNLVSVFNLSEAVNDEGREEHVNDFNNYQNEYIYLGVKKNSNNSNLNSNTSNSPSEKSGYGAYKNFNNSSKKSLHRPSFEEEAHNFLQKRNSSRKLDENSSKNIPILNPINPELVHNKSSSQSTFANKNNNQKISSQEISFKNDRFSINSQNPNSSNNLYTYTNESYISACSVNLNTNNIVILDSEIKSSKKLLIEDFNGDLLYGRKLMIDAAGLNNGLRNKRDGFSFFGPVKENSKGEVINDYIINYYKANDKILQNNSHDKCVKRLFVIFYDRISQKYFFRNINDSIIKEKSLIYIKIENQYFIENKKFFLMGQLLFNVEPGYKEKLINITVFFKDSENSKNYSFSVEDSPITIGRSSSNMISIDNSFLSKQQCILEYDKIYSIWKIKDGFGGKKSTHGTWLLVDSKYEITDLTYVKISNNIIKINFAI